MQNVSLKKYLLTSALGFGLGGAVWGGWDLYGSDVDYPLTILGAISLGIFGGLGLSIFSKNWKLILRSCGLGMLGSIIGFFTALLGIYNLPNLWGFLLSFILPPLLSEKGNAIIDLIFGIQNLRIGVFLLNFVLAGIFIGLFFAIALKIKIWPMIWRGGLGFGLGAIISPIIGNLLGNLFNSLFLSYLITFSLIGIILGLFLGWGMHKCSGLKI